MAILDTLQEIFYSLRHNKLRTFLTAFGVFWGIFMLIMLLGSGRGMQNGIEQGFTADVQDSVWIFSGRTSIPFAGLPTGRQINFTEADLAAIQQEISGIRFVSSENPLGSTGRSDIVVKSKTRSESYGVFGVGKNYFNIKIGQDLLQGRKLDIYDELKVRKVATIGDVIAENLFPGQSPIGQAIEINNISFLVVGVFHDPGQNGQMSERIYIPMSIYQQTFGQGKRHIRLITYQPMPEVDPWETERKVVALLQKRHKVAEDDRSAIRSNNLLRNAERINGLFVAINGFIWFVGLGTLTAGIVGISNIMMITVKERTMEIGVRKALGARPINIVSSLLFESVLITSIAGYLGLVMAVALLEGVNTLLVASNANLQYFKRPEVDFDIAIASIVILVVVGMLAGFGPAWRAAKISPVEAMREHT